MKPEPNKPGNTHKPTVLFADYTLAPATPPQRQACLQNALAAAGRVPRKTSLPAQLKTQLGYMGLWFWLGLAALLGGFLLLFLFIGQQAAPYPVPTRAVLLLFVVTGPAAAGLAAPILARSHTHGMWELEEAAYHNLHRLTSLRIMLCTLAALPVLAGIGIAGFGTTGALAGATALAAPFLAASGANYLILGRLRGNAGSLLCVGACFLIALAFGTPLYTDFFVTGPVTTYAPLWCAGLLGCSLLFFLFCAKNFTHSATLERNPHS